MSDLFFMVVSRDDPMFKGRSWTVINLGDDKGVEIPVPDGLIRCDICGEKIEDPEIYLLRQKVGNDEVSLGALCRGCRGKYHSNLYARTIKLRHLPRSLGDKKMTELDLCREKILSKIGKPVKFSYPKFGKMKGILVDRVVMHGRSITRIKDMFRVIDLIEFDVHGKKERLVRFGYYIYKKGKLRWGSQTTYSDTPDAVADLFIMACGRPWFKDIMLRVCETG